MKTTNGEIFYCADMGILANMQIKEKINKNNGKKYIKSTN